MDSDEIRKILTDHLKFDRCEVEDQSAMHAGHAEAKQGGGSHFAVLLVSTDFVGKNQLQRHRMVIGVLKNAFKTKIHALALKTYTPDEYQRLSS